MPTALNSKLKLFAAFVIGAALPLHPMGIAVTQGALSLGLIFLLAATPFDPAVRSMYRTPLYERLAIALAVMFAIWFATVPWSNGPYDSFTTVLRTALYMLGSLLIWSHLIVHKDMHRTTLTTLLGVSAVFILIVFLFLVFPDALWEPLRSALGKTTKASLHFKSFSSVLLCLVPITIWGGVRLGGNWRWLGWGTIPFILFTIIATQSASSVAGLIIMFSVTVLVMLWAKSKISKVALVAPIVAIVSGLTWVWYTRRVSYEVSGTYLPSWLVDPHRQVIWKFTFEKFLEAPWTGHGVNRINYVQGADTYRLDIQGAMISSHPHNWPLEILSETGIFGFSAAIFALALLAWQLLVRYKSTQDPAVLTLIAISAAFFGSSLFNFSIWSTWWLLTFFVLFAIVSAAIRYPEEKAKAP